MASVASASVTDSMRRLAFAAVLAFSSFVVRPALAQERPDDPITLKAEADSLFDRGRYADAYDLYKRAYAKTSDPALLYNQARALESMGEYPEALEKLEAFSQEAPPDVRAKVPKLEELTADLRARTATITIKTNTPSARLYVRGKDLGLVERERTVLARAGDATIRVEADGFTPFSREVLLPGGGSLEIEAQLERKATRTGGGAEPITSRWWFWTALGVVVAGGATIAVVALTTEKDPERGTFDPSPIRVKGFSF